jgi:uncharacterized Zn finger protein (UPF0148 family)
MSNEPTHCPRCGSPSPYMHPAVQHEGEVSICPNPWHAPLTDADQARAAHQEIAGIPVVMSNDLPDNVIIVGHVADPRTPAVPDPDQANLTANLAEQRLLGLRDDLLKLIGDNFHAEGNKLICNRCDEVVTWVTKHCKERHGDDVEVWPLTKVTEGEQLW